MRFRVRPYALLLTFALAAATTSAWATVAVLGLEPDIEHPSSRLVLLALAALVLPSAMASVFVPTAARSVAPKRGLVAGRILALLVVGSGLVAMLIDGEADTVVLLGLGVLGVIAAFESAFGDATVRATVPADHLARERGVLATTVFGGFAVGAAAAVATLWAGRTVHVASLVTLGAVAALLCAAATGPSPIDRARPTPGVRDVLRSSWHAMRRDPALRRASAAVLIAALLGGVFLAASSVRAARVADSALAAAIAVIAFAAAAAASSTFAGKISGRASEPGLIPLGLLVLTLPLAIAGAILPGTTGMVIAAGATGLGLGFIVVPVETLLQRRAHAMVRSVVRAFGLVVGGIGATAASAFLHLGMDVREVLLGAAVLSLIAFVVAREVLPAAFTRMSFVALGHLVFDLRVRGLRNVPREGPVLIVSNHVSLLDWWAIGMAAERPVRFVIDRSFYEKPMFHRLLVQQSAIPVEATGTPAELLRSLRSAGQALDDGHAVCVFAEGQITRLGTLLPLQRGIESIARKRAVPILPAYIDGLLGSATSYARGPIPPPRSGKLRRPITISFGDADSGIVDARALGARIEELERAAWSARVGDREPLHRPLLRRAFPYRGRGFRVGERESSLFSLLCDGAALAVTWRRALQRGDRVVSACEHGRTAAVVAIAASLSGRRLTTIAPARLAAIGASATSWTGSDEVLVDAGARARLPQEIGGIAFVDVDLQIASLPRRRRFAAGLALLASPPRALELWCGASQPLGPTSVALRPDEAHQLSHAAVAASIEAMARVFGVTREDRILLAVPASQAFGVAACWWALQLGHRLDWQPGEGDAALDLARACAATGATVLFVPIEHVSALTSRVPAAALGSLRLVVAVGSAPADDDLDAFEERYGLRPLRASGLEDGTPLAFAEAEHGRARGVFQRGRRRGSVGRPAPATRVEVRQTDGAPAEPGEPGLMTVRSPLRSTRVDAATDAEAAPAAPAEPLRARRDRDGFVFLEEPMPREDAGSDAARLAPAMPGVSEAAAAGTGARSSATEPDLDGGGEADLDGGDGAAEPPPA